MTRRLGMLIELDRCLGCGACETACRETWDTGPGAGRNWVRSHEASTRAAGLQLAFYPGQCMQCEKPACVPECPTGATHADDSGRVVVDPAVCIGCGNCVPACPYGARRVDETRGVVSKCDLCAPLVDSGRTPACVTTCPAVCRTVGDLAEPSSALSRLIRETLARPLTTERVQLDPKVHFAGDRERALLVAAGAVGEVRAGALTAPLTKAGPVLARLVVPSFFGLALMLGLVKNLADAVVRSRRRLRRPEQGEAAVPEAGEAGEGPGQGDGESRPSRESGNPGVASILDPRLRGGDETGLPKSFSRTLPGPWGPGARRQAAPAEPSGARATAASTTQSLARHHLALRLLHAFNLASLLGLLATGMALFVQPAFALLGSGPAAIGAPFGVAGVMRLHVLWGLAWAAIVLPTFLLFKRGGLEALAEVRWTRRDVEWLVRKPLAMMGLDSRPLPPQDKYNAGQKLFALAVLALTSLIVATGVAMAFHLGGPAAVSRAVVVHGAAVALLLLGLAVHVTMAAVVAEERAALVSMLTGRISRRHAERHYSNWAREAAREETNRGEGLGRS